MFSSALFLLYDSVLGPMDNGMISISAFVVEKCAWLPRESVSKCLHYYAPSSLIVPVVVYGFTSAALQEHLVGTT